MFDNFELEFGKSRRSLIIINRNLVKVDITIE